MAKHVNENRPSATFLIFIIIGFIELIELFPAYITILDWSINSPFVPILVGKLVNHILAIIPF